MNIKSKKETSPWLIFSIGVLTVSGIYLLLVWKKIPPEVPWFYSLPWGENQLMPKMGLPIVLGVGALGLSLGSLLSTWAKKDDKIVEQAVMVSLAFICFLLVINMAKILIIFT